MKLHWKLWDMKNGAPPKGAFHNGTNYRVLQVQEETRGAYIRADRTYESFIETTWVDVLLEVTV